MRSIGRRTKRKKEHEEHQPSLMHCTKPRDGNRRSPLRHFPCARPPSAFTPPADAIATSSTRGRSAGAGPSRPRQFRRGDSVWFRPADRKTESSWRRSERPDRGSRRGFRGRGPGRPSPAAVPAGLKQRLVQHPPQRRSHRTTSAELSVPGAKWKSDRCFLPTLHFALLTGTLHCLFPSSASLLGKMVASRTGV